MSVKLVHYTKKKNARGLAPIWLRIYIDGKESYISTGHYIHKSQWDKTGEKVKNHPLQDDINTDILQRKKEALESLVSARVKGERSSTTALKGKLQAKNDFFIFCENQISALRNKRAKLTIGNYEKHLRKLETFVGARELALHSITRELLTDFENWIYDNTASRKESSNYAFAIMKTMRTFIKMALADKLIDHDPFQRYQMPEETPGDKDHLSFQELTTWTNYYKRCTDPVLKECALYFLFGCYSGMRISDWTKFDLKKNVHKDYVMLRATKNGEPVVTPLTNRFRFVLNEMKQWPLTLEEPTLNEKFKVIAAACKINKHLSSHCARKTFAVTMCLERGISSETAATMMGITLDTFVKSYSRVTPEKIKLETLKAWKGL